MGAESSLLLDKILKEPKPLSENQRNAVLSNKRYIRVIAGAGAGKTETLTRKIVSLLLVEKVPPASIVAFTFTEKAAQSMKSRVYERVKHSVVKINVPILGKCSSEQSTPIVCESCRIISAMAVLKVLTKTRRWRSFFRFGWDLHLTGGRNYSENCELFKQTLNVIYSEMIPDAVLDKRDS